MVHGRIARFAAKRIIKEAAKRSANQALDVRTRRSGGVKSVGVGPVSVGVPPQFDSTGDLPL